MGKGIRAHIGRHLIRKKLRKHKKEKSFVKGKAKKAGLPPGTIVYTGEKKEAKVRLWQFRYNQDTVEEKKDIDIRLLSSYLKAGTENTVMWLNIDGVHDPRLIEEIGIHFNIHPLVLEDIANTTQRPKLEDYEDYVYIVIRMLTYDKTEGGIHSEQLSLILGKNYILTFQEEPGDIFDNIRDRIRTGKGRVRRMGADYLAYVIMDNIIDQYYKVLEGIGDRVEDMQHIILRRPEKQMLQGLHNLKRDLLFIRKSIWPLRDVMDRILRKECELFTDPTLVYIKDVFDHTIQLMDQIDTYRDVITTLLECYLSNVTVHTNLVMKRLTVITTIFMPLSVLAGIGGMSEWSMITGASEDSFLWQYGLFLGITIIIGVLTYIILKKKGWT
ncbi:MAG: magnesium/cobalt transporter CorA [Thermoplasmata archaeon]